MGEITSEEYYNAYREVMTVAIISTVIFPNKSLYFPSRKNLTNEQWHRYVNYLVSGAWKRYCIFDGTHKYEKAVTWVMCSHFCGEISQMEMREWLSVIGECQNSDVTEEQSWKAPVPI